MKVLSIIPARSGSQGVPDKNIRNLAGKPLLAYSIQAALNSNLISDVFLSTDSKEYAEIAKQHGAWVPFLRASELAQNDSTAVSVAKNIIQRLRDEFSKEYDVVIWLQPTSPFRTAQDIDQSIEFLKEDEVDSVVSVYEVSDHHPSRMYRLQDGFLQSFVQEHPSMLRQNNEKIYHRNGAIYAFKNSTLEKYGNFFGDKIKPYLMPRERSINIDDELDFFIADYLMKRQQMNSEESQ